MKFRTKFYEHVNNATLTALNTDNVHVAIRLGGVEVFTGLLETIVAPLTGQVLSMPYSIVIEAGDVLAITWATPLNTVNTIGITAHFESGSDEGLVFNQNFDTYGYDIGQNVATSVVTGTNADIVLYGFNDTDDAGNPFYDAAISGLRTVILAYRKPFSNVAVFYNMTPRYFNTGRIVSMASLTDYEVLTVTLSTLVTPTLNDNNRKGEYNNDEDTTIYYSVAQHVSTVGGIVIVQRDTDSLLLLQVNWLPVSTNAHVLDTVSNVVTITPTLNFTGVTKVFVNGVSKFAFLDLRLTYTIIDELLHLYNSIVYVVTIADANAFVWDNTNFVYSRILTRFHKFVGRVIVQSKDYPLVVLSDNSYQLIPNSFQYVTKTGENTYRIFNPYNTTLTYQLQALENGRTFVDSGTLVSILPDAFRDITLVEGIYNLKIGTDNWIIVVDNLIRKGILKLLKQDFNACTSCNNPCADVCDSTLREDSELYTAMVTNYLAYLNLMSELASTTFMLGTLTPTKLEKVVLIASLYARLITFASRLN